jgi:UDPglucose 6-dehydrogenase
MSMRICVYGLWHLGAVTAACLAGPERHVIGLDRDSSVIDNLARGCPPIAEPGLAELVQVGLAADHLEFSSNLDRSLADADVLWVTFDTPVDENDHADPDWVRAQLEAVRPAVRPGTLVVISSQIPVGFSRSLEQDWRSSDPSLSFACIPENLRLGDAVNCFRNPERLVIGVGESTSRQRLAEILGPLCDELLWMSLESAEMSKHALNTFLALCATYANELGRVCEVVEADASDVERALRSDPRVGPRAYLAPGGPVAGGTLARDFTTLQSLAQRFDVQAPLLNAISDSNVVHQAWIYDHLERLLAETPSPRVALLGLTYKPGTDTLRRSFAVELGQQLTLHGISVSAFDPAVRALPPELIGFDLAVNAAGALDGADAAVLATPWPEFRQLQAADFVQHMRNPRIVDQAGFLAHLAEDPRVLYLRVGRRVSHASPIT